MKNIIFEKVDNGIYWLEFPDANLKIVCGCPENLLKLLINKKYIGPCTVDGVTFETGPDAILFREQAIISSDAANESELPVLQMMFLQGKIIPGHPNNDGNRPLLIGTDEILQDQLNYLDVSYFGLQEGERHFYNGSGLEKDAIDQIYKTKNFFAFGGYESPLNHVEIQSVTNEKQEIRNEVFFERTSYNCYRFYFKDEHVDVNLNIRERDSYVTPYTFVHRDIPEGKFVLTNIGCGDAWNAKEPCFSSLITFNGKRYLIDTPPNLTFLLEQLDIVPDMIDGIFSTHCHDDHLGGMDIVLRRQKKMPYYATPPVYACCQKKFSNLFNVPASGFNEYCDYRPLVYNTKNEITPGLFVEPSISPHPVDTSIFYFSGTINEESKVYGHCGDLVALDLLVKLIDHKDPRFRITQEFYDQVQSAYFRYADVKKIDIGGGMIHGKIEDFIDDPSPIKILGHIHRNLNALERQHGEFLSFGESVVLIP